MIDDFKFTGIWKGEYAFDDKFQPTLIRTTIPFILRVQFTQDGGIFSGICQDDPETSKINMPADIVGTVRNYEIFFVKRYPKTLMLNDLGDLTIGEEPHPDIVYRGKLKERERLTGVWLIERTFRKVAGQLTEIPKTSGQWWMERY